MKRSIISTLSAAALFAFVGMLAMAGNLAVLPTPPSAGISVAAFEQAAIEEAIVSPSAGRIVHLCLSEACAAEINQRREADHRTGNSVEPGEIVPMIIVKAWSETCVNGQAILDGSDSLWCTSVQLDEAAAGEPPTMGTWRWPERVA